jgi:streptogramin lyase
MAKPLIHARGFLYVQTTGAAGTRTNELDIFPIGDESGTYVIRIGPYGTVWYVLLCFVNKDI